MIFSLEFLDLWEEDSPMRQRWSQLEELSNDFDNQIIDVLTIQNRSRTQREINLDIKNAMTTAESNYRLFMESTNIMLNRILLRSMLKIRDSNELFFNSCDNANAYGCCLAQRSIIEHLGLLQYLYEKISWKDNIFRTKEIKKYFTEVLDPLYLGSKFNWDKLNTETSSLRDPEIKLHEWVRSKTYRLPRSSDLVNSLDFNCSKLNITQKGSIKLMYTILSDILHPSTGGDFIYAEDMYGRLNFQNEFNLTFKRFITLTCFLCQNSLSIPLT